MPGVAQRPPGRCFPVGGRGRATPAGVRVTVSSAHAETTPAGGLPQPPLAVSQAGRVGSRTRATPWSTLSEAPPSLLSSRPGRPLPSNAPLYARCSRVADGASVTRARANGASSAASIVATSALVVIFRVIFKLKSVPAVPDQIAAQKKRKLSNGRFGVHPSNLCAHPIRHGRS